MLRSARQWGSIRFLGSHSRVGLDGRGTKVGNAVAYRRAGGTSFWTAGTDHGVEEWISLDEGKQGR